MSELKTPLKEGRICLTGGGGYLGRHIAAALMEQGFAVRITLRNIAQSNGIYDDICAYLQQKTLPLDFAQADLTKADGWAEALASCDGLVHAASPFPDRPPKDGRALVQLAVDGTERVLRTAHAQGINRIIHTSSIASVTNTVLSSDRTHYDERDWSKEDDHRTDSYALSKLRSERCAWDVANELGIDLTVLNPGLIFGPPIGDSGATSVGVVRRYLRGRDPALPRAAFPSIDVRDVAKAHAKALLTPASIGQRLILTERTLSLEDIAKTVGKLYPSRAIKTGAASHAMVRMAAKFDPTLENILPHLGEAPQVSSEQARTILDMSFGAAPAAISDTAQTLMQRELAATAL